ncbi:sarcosine oxidase subunit gamma [Rhizobium sp. FY34]|uniref:sarcosine oxidase subunit gamma n=1 Tax=Rhizobium sp. FY34 TaxID=2562309 RepID=UPI0010C0DE5B|nr:sarcosine oxidase subunit gamma [Rhizobium sp. FY34]
MAELATRTLPLAGLHGGSSVASLTPAEPAERVSLRARPEDVEALSNVLGLQLPMAAKTSASAGARHALWLGPDEWLLIDEGEGGMMAALSACTALHSATDISHRNTAILVAGSGAAKTLNGGCPLDLSLKAFPVGACARTLFGKIEVVVFRTAGNAFRLEFWRSFSDYAFGLLHEAAEDAAI